MHIFTAPSDTKRTKIIDKNGAIPEDGKDRRG